MMAKGYILSLGDYSGVWSEPYARAGYEVIRVDLKFGLDAILWPSPTSSDPRLPSQFSDIRDYIGKVHGILSAPVCTYFSGSGAKHPRTDEQIKQGLSFVDATVRLAWVLKPVFWVLENPIGKLPLWLGEPRLRFNPCDYGDPYTKRTALYGEFNTNLPRSEVEPTEGSKLWKNYGGKSERTKELRSITPTGFANAFYKANP